MTDWSTQFLVTSDIRRRNYLFVASLLEPTIGVDAFRYIQEVLVHSDFGGIIESVV